MKSTHETNHWIKTHGDLALDLVRLYLGIGLVLKAVYFMNHSEYLLQTMQSMGSMWIVPGILIHYIILAHLVGGFCLALGLFTRTAALFQLPILFSALFYVYLPAVLRSMDARQNAEFTGLVLFLLILLSIYGSGRWSLDHFLARRERSALFETPTHSPTTT